MSYAGEHIAFSASGKSILRSISLAIRSGEFTAVAGPNGAGKSTLLKIISGELTPESGRVTINGAPLRQISVRNLSLLRAVLPQHTSVTFPFTVEEIVALGRSPHTASYRENREMMRQAMLLTDTLRFRDRYWHTLSGGERQRVMLARVIAQILPEHSKTPKYLLLDEPASWLDMARQQEIFSIVNQLCSRNIGVLAVVHDLNLAAAFADRMIFIKNGQVVAEGSIPETFTKEIIASVYDCPVKIWRESALGVPFVISGAAASFDLSSPIKNKTEKTYEYVSR